MFWKPGRYPPRSRMYSTAIAPAHPSLIAPTGFACCASSNLISATRDRTPQNTDNQDYVLCSTCSVQGGSTASWRGGLGAGRWEGLGLLGDSPNINFHTEAWRQLPPDNRPDRQKIPISASAIRHWLALHHSQVLGATHQTRRSSSRDPPTFHRP
jgi:hypothetical protein